MILRYRHFGDITLNSSSSSSTNIAPSAVPSNSSISIPSFSTIQLPPVPTSQQQQSINTAPTDRLPPTVPPPIMPPFNFSAPNPQQQYFQPIPPSVFTNSQQQQQQQQLPFLFNPICFPTSNNPSHSQENNGSGHGHNH